MGNNVGCRAALTFAPWDGAPPGRRCRYTRAGSGVTPVTPEALSRCGIEISRIGRDRCRMRGGSACLKHVLRANSAPFTSVIGRSGAVPSASRRRRRRAPLLSRAQPSRRVERSRPLHVGRRIIMPRPEWILPLTSAPVAGRSSPRQNRQRRVHQGVSPNAPRAFAVSGEVTSVFSRATSFERMA